MQENKKIINYDGLYGDESGRYSAEYIFLESIASRSKDFDWHINPHVHIQLFQVFIIKNGSLSFQDAFESQTIEAPCVIVIPATALHGLTYNPPVEGFILTLSASIIEDIFQTSHPVWQTFEKIRVLQYFTEENLFDTMLTLLKHLEEELFSEQPERSLMIRALLTQFFLYTHRLTTQKNQWQGDSLQMGYFRRFQQLIKGASPHQSIPAFAEQLHISPVHLNRICKAVAGKSAIEMVHQNLIQEAQKYLLHTSHSVSEIAYLLEFEYPNYFAKLFKKYVGLSPVEFRRQDRR